MQRGRARRSASSRCATARDHRRPGQPPSAAAQPPCATADRAPRAQRARSWPPLRDRFAEALPHGAAGHERRTALRTFLTMLGIIIGIASVVSVVALGEGLAAARCWRTSARMGTNTIEVYPGAASATCASSRGSDAAMPRLTPRRLARQSFVDSATPERRHRRDRALRQQSRPAPRSTGVGEQYFRVARHQAARMGSRLRRRGPWSAWTQVIGDRRRTRRRQLFPDTRADPIGQVMLLGNDALPRDRRGRAAAEHGPSAATEPRRAGPYTTVMGRLLGQQP